MIVVTGAAGFIGSCLISRLNQDNFNYIIAVDDFSNEEKNKNLEGKKIQLLHRKQPIPFKRDKLIFTIPKKNKQTCI